MGGAVVHFEIMGRDADKLRTFYSQLFGWSINADNQGNYGTVDRSENLSSQGIGIGGGVAHDPEGHVIGVIKAT